MGSSVGTGVEMPVELRIRLLGPITIARAGAPVVLPSSRKLRALLAYLALAPGSVTRSHLCELLWEVPNDPRGELRWCLSKLRGAMGPTFASFAEEAKATAFIEQHGGKLYRFTEVTPEMAALDGGALHDQRM